MQSGCIGSDPSAQKDHLFFSGPPKQIKIAWKPFPRPKIDTWTCSLLHNWCTYHALHHHCYDADSYYMTQHGTITGKPNASIHGNYGTSNKRVIWVQIDMKFKSHQKINLILSSHQIYSSIMHERQKASRHLLPKIRRWPKMKGMPYLFKLKSEHLIPLMLTFTS